MKIIASILILSMLFMGLNRFVETMNRIVVQTEQSCDMDCCCQHDQGCEGQEGCEKKPEKEQACHCGCDCSITIQIVAIGNHFPTLDDLIPTAFDHGSFLNNYQNEYLSPHFQPPRIV